jgi:hypothetical protein
MGLLPSWLPAVAEFKPPPEGESSSDTDHYELLSTDDREVELGAESVERDADTGGYRETRG